MKDDITNIRSEQFISMKGIASIIILVFLLSCNKKDVFYLDNNFPTLKAELYAEGIVNGEKKYVQDLVMNADGTEQYFVQTASFFNYYGISRIRKTNQTVVMDTLEFHRSFITVGEPMLSHDDQYLYFAAAVNYPTKIWRMVRNSENDWQCPKQVVLPGDTTICKYYPSLSKDNHLYYTTWTGGESSENTGKMYRAIPNKEGAYIVEKLNIPGTGSDPYIARDDSYLIFNSRENKNYPENYGAFDMYICFKMKDGSWGKAINLGPEINTQANDIHAFVSPDEKFLFFTRRDGWNDAKSSKIFWISTKIIEEIRAEINFSE